jgi:hypothetical protein
VRDFVQPNRIYNWTDDGTAISIIIQIDADITSSRVDVKILPSSVRAGIKGSPPILQVRLYFPPMLILGLPTRLQRGKQEKNIC